MKTEKLLIIMLISVGLFLPACSCSSWTSFWGGDPDVECATHWKWKCPEATVPCGAPAVGKTQQMFPSPAGEIIRLEKMVPQEVSANEPFNYRIKVTNLTNRELHNVMVMDRVPESLTFESSDPAIMEHGEGRVHWSLGSLQANASKMISASAVVSGAGTIKSCAEVTFDSPICAQINIVEPALRLAKSAPESSLTCDRIALDYTITNTGSGYACDVIVEDSLPEGLVTAEGDNKVMFTIDQLGPGQSRDFSVMTDASKTGIYSSKAIAKSRTSGTVESNMTTTKVSQPLLMISESGPSRQYVGRSLTYEITISNTGDGIARNTVLEASVPEEIDFSSATMGGQFSRSSPGRVIWELGELAPGESRTVSMTLSGVLPGSWTTSTMAKAYCAETAHASAETVLSGIPGILLEVIDVSDPIELGASETYVITVTNQGSAEDTGIMIKCMLESGMEYLSSEGPTEASVVGNEISFDSLSSLAPKRQVSWRVMVMAASVGDKRFKVELSSDQLERVVEETESTRFYE